MGRAGRTNLFPGAPQSLLIESEINHVLMGLQGARARFNFAPVCILCVRAALHQVFNEKRVVRWLAGNMKRCGFVYYICAQKKGRDYCRCIFYP